MNLQSLIRIANKLDRNGHAELADELDDIIRSLATDIMDYQPQPEHDPENMNEEELNDAAEDIVMMLANKFQEAGFDIPAQELFEIFEQVGIDPAAVADEIQRRRQ